MIMKLEWTDVITHSYCYVIALTGSLVFSWLVAQMAPLTTLWVTVRSYSRFHLVVHRRRRPYLKSFWSYEPNCTRRLLLSGTIGLYLKEAVVCGCVGGWLVCNGVSLSGPWNSMSSMSFSCTCGWVRDLKFCIRIPSLNTFLRAWFHHDPNIINTLKIP